MNTLKLNNQISEENLSISPKLILDEAKKREIECQLIDKYTLQMKKNNVSWYVRGSRTSLQSSIGKSIADKKDLTKLFLQRNNIPTANYITYFDKTSFEAVKNLTFPIVMKPTIGNHGDNVYVGIRNYEEALAVFPKIKVDKECPGIAEELLQGKEYRILCIDYVFVAAAFRRPAFVIGDGSHTIAQLIEEKNSHPWRGNDHESPLTKIKVDEITINLLERQNLNLDSILESGLELEIKRTANLSQGGEAENITNQVCTENRELFETIAKICDLNTIGIDVMCSDISSPLKNQKKAGIIEVNVSPGLRMHHFPTIGEPLNVAGKILDMVEKKYEILHNNA